MIYDVFCKVACVANAFSSCISFEKLQND